MSNVKYGASKREITEILRSREINPTAQRVEIAHLLLQELQHLSADEIFHKLNEEYEQVSQATVYNTIRLFVEKGVVRELIFSADRIYYDSNTEEHHHFIDTESGRIIDLPAASLSSPDLKKLLNIPDLEELEVDVSSVSLVIKGKLKPPA